MRLPDELTPETLRSIIRQIADGIEDPEVAIALLVEVGDKHASVWETRIEALEKERDADWRKFLRLRNNNERIRVLGEQLAEGAARIEALEKTSQDFLDILTAEMGEVTVSLKVAERLLAFKASLCGEEET